MSAVFFGYCFVATVGVWKSANNYAGKKIWSIPFGARLDKYKNVIANGDKNFGGVLTTAGGLIFATGTPDTKVYAYDTDGNLVWFDEVSFAGSAAPMSYKHNSCQFVLFAA